MTLWRVRATLDDRPGFLAVLAASLGLRSVNILAVQVHATEEGAVDEFLVDAPDGMTGEQLIDAVRKGRGRDPWASRADARGLVDPPAQVLGLATGVVREPDLLGTALRGLLNASVSWLATSSAARLAGDRTRMMLPDPAGGAFLVERASPVFTPAEYARAQALVGLATAVERPAATLLLPDGSEILLRTADSDDVERVERMHARCTGETRRRRYLGATPHLGRLVDPAHGQALVGVGPHGRVVALANLIGEGAQAEVALLVEDGWQRRGIGTALLRRLVRHAERSGFAAVSAHTGADNEPLLRTVRRLGRPLTYDRDGPLLTVTMALTVQVAG